MTRPTLVDRLQDMSRSRHWRLLLSAPLLIVVAVGPEPPALSQRPDSPGLQRAREVISLINANDAAASGRYAAEHMEPAAPAMHGMPPFDFARFAADVHARSRKLTIVGLEETPQGVTVTARNELLGSADRLLVRVAAAPPHRVAAVTVMDPVPLPPNRKTHLSAQQIADRFDRYVSGLASIDQFSGAVLVATGDRVLLQKAAGFANRDHGVPATIRTKFNLASMTKMFTAVAVAQLVEAGKLSYDDPAVKFVPDLLHGERAPRVLIRHLLSHTSGLGDFLDRVTGPARLYRTIDEMARLLADDSIAFEPGTRYRYSNSAFLVLGAMVQRISGESYFDYVQSHIFTPAGMTDTAFVEVDAVVPAIAVGYERRAGFGNAGLSNTLFQLPVKGSPAGGAYSTVGDLFRFSAALRRNRLVSRAGTELLLSPKPNAPRYGYGFYIEDPARRIVGHAGGYFGAANNLDMVLDEDFTIVVLSNVGAHGPSTFSALVAYGRGLAASAR